MKPPNCSINPIDMKHENVFLQLSLKQIVKQISNIEHLILYTISYKYISSEIIIIFCYFYFNIDILCVLHHHTHTLILCYNIDLSNY